MEENKNMEMEVQNETTDMMEIPPMESKESSGPSKGFVTLVVGGLAAAVAGGIVAFRRHKKKKLENEEFDDFVDVDGKEVSDEEEDDSRLDGNDQEPKVVK